MSSTGKGEGKGAANGKSEDDKGSNKVKGKSKVDRGSNKDKVSDEGEGKGSGKGESKSKDDKGSIKDQGIRKDNKSKDDNKGSNKVKCKSKDDSNKEGKDKGVKRKHGAVGGGLQIIVVTGAWEDIWVNVDVEEDDKIKNVKSNIAKVLQWPCNLELELEYKGEILKDTRTLLDYHVENESRLYVRLALQSLGSDYTIQQ
jgi:hypothetical protein